MYRGKTILTTGEVAKLCSVAPRTVSNWFDSGQLRGYRIPGSRDRRIPMEQLVRFMRAHDMPLDGLDDGNTRVLVLDGDASWAATVREALNAEGGFKSMTADNAFEAGSALSEFDPHVLLLDTELTDVTPRKISRFIRSISDRQETCLIGTGFEMTEATGQALLQDGFDGYLIKPFELHELTGLIESRMPQHAGSPSSQR